MFTVSIKTDSPELSVDRRISLEEAIEMALCLIYERKNYATDPDYPDDWKTLADALKNAKGV